MDLLRGKLLLVSCMYVSPAPAGAVLVGRDLGRCRTARGEAKEEGCACGEDRAGRDMMDSRCKGGRRLVIFVCWKFWRPRAKRRGLGMGEPGRELFVVMCYH